MRRRSTSGTTVDFPFINIFGFLAYFVSTASFYWSPLIRTQYALRNNGLAPTVTLNDVVFAFHGVILCLVVTSQYLFPGAWGFDHRAPGRKPSRVILGITAGSVLAIAIVMLLVDPSPSADAKTAWAWIDVMYAVSYVKLLITVVKYAPQLAYNFRNKSTVGWSISTILLDISGGVLSIAQLAIDSWLLRDWSGVTGNPAKFFLGNISIIYDVMFIMQHYVWYSEGGQHSLIKDDEYRRLLERGDADAAT